MMFPPAATWTRAVGLRGLNDFIIVIDLKPKKKPLEELIKNAYKENKLAKDILTILYKWEGCKVYYWLK